MIWAVVVTLQTCDIYNITNGLYNEKLVSDSYFLMTHRVTSRELFHDI